MDCKGGLGCAREGGFMLNRRWARVFGFQVLDWLTDDESNDGV